MVSFFIAGEIIRLRALFNARDADEKLALLRTSLTMATAQGAKLWQLRAATNLAELLLNLRDESAAHALLEPICRLVYGRSEHPRTDFRADLASRTWQVSSPVPYGRCVLSSDQRPTASCRARRRRAVQLARAWPGASLV
jgi:hypothetical protein